MKFVDYKILDNTAIVTLNRPDRLNAISTALLKDFVQALRLANNDDSVKVILLNGAGRAFCAGDDLKEFGEIANSRELTVEHVELIQEVTKLTLGSDKPVVGAIHGYAVGGGFEWLLNCDMVVAADNLTCFFPEMGWGNFVTGGVTYLLPRSVGYQKAMELIMLGEKHTAKDLKELNLVSWIVKEDELIEKGLEVCRSLASKSSESIRNLKRVVNKDISNDLWNAVNLEKDVTIDIFLTEEASSRVREFFNK